MTVRARSIAVIAGAELRRVLRGRRGVVLAVLYVGFYLFWGNLLARIAAGASIGVSRASNPLLVSRKAQVCLPGAI